MKRQKHGSSKTDDHDRKTLEKKRRNEMKALYSELSFLISSSHDSKEAISMPDQLDEAVNYINMLEKRLERLKQKKESLIEIDKRKSVGSLVMGGRTAQFEVRSIGSALEVVLISGMDSQSVFFEVIRMLHEEGADVVNASFCVVNDNIFHTILSEQVISVPDQLDETVKYIKKLEKQLERTKEKKNYLMGIDKSKIMSSDMMGGRPAQIEVRSTGSSIEVVVVSGIDCQSMFFEIIRVLHEEGANVVNASFSIVNNSIFHTIHSEVGESAHGNGAARISSRVKKFVHEYNSKLSMNF